MSVNVIGYYIDRDVEKEKVDTGKLSKLLHQHQQSL